MILLVLILLGADPDPLLVELPAASSPAEMKVRIAKGHFESVRWLEHDANQALAEGLIKSRLLETLNRLHLTPTAEDGALDPRAFETIAVAEGGREGRSWVAAFGTRAAKKRLSYLMLRLRVAVDPSRDRADPDRLHRLKDALGDLSRAGVRLEPKERDRYGNVFGWEGPGPSGTRAAAIYLPELDELRVVWRAG
jgi:hypothetical protein